MKILRVQNKSGIGPYFTSRDSKSQAICRMQNEHSTHSSRDLHPPAQLDTGIDRYIDFDEYCGFLNEDQLHNWFSDDELKLLEEGGFSVVEVDGKIVATGEHQVLFTLND